MYEIRIQYFSQSNRYETQKKQNPKKNIKNENKK